VLKKVAGGGMVWGDATTLTFATPLRLQMVNGGDNNLVDSLFWQNAEAGTNITMIAGSSMTINGPFESTGTVKLGNNSASAAVGGVTIAGVATVGGTLGVTGAATLSNNLTVNGNSQLGDAVADTHSINRTVEAGVALSVDSVGTTGNYAAKFYSGGSLAAWIKHK
jgi:hypothetical protein